MTTDYRLAPTVAARLFGIALIVIAVLILTATVLIAVFNLHTITLVVPVALGLVIFVAGAVTWSRRGWVVRVTPEGYRVQWVRGVGTASARWSDVEDAVTTTVAGAPVVQLRLRDGRSSIIPVEILATDREQFVRELQEHLQSGSGNRRL